MTLFKIDSLDINDYTKLIHCLKNGCILTEFYKEKPVRVLLENSGPCSDNYQFREFPHDEFKILEDNGFIVEESGNWETGEIHYIWDDDLYARPLQTQHR